MHQDARRAPNVLMGAGVKNHGIGELRALAAQRVAGRSAGRWMVRGAPDSWKSQVEKKT